MATVFWTKSKNLLIPLQRRKLPIITKQARVREAIAKIDKHVADLLYRARRSHVVAVETLIAQYQHELWKTADSYTSKLTGAVGNPKLMHVTLVQLVSHLERIGEQYAEQAANLGFERCLQDLVLHGYLHAYQTPVVAPKEYSKAAMMQNHDYLHQSLLPTLHEKLSTTDDVAQAFNTFANRIKMYGHYLWRISEQTYRNGALDFNAKLKTDLKEIGTTSSGNMGHKGIPGHKGGSLPNPNSKAQQQKSAFLAIGENLYHYENNLKVKELVDKKLYGAAKKEIKANPNLKPVMYPKASYDELKAQVDAKMQSAFDTELSILRQPTLSDQENAPKNMTNAEKFALNDWSGSTYGPRSLALRQGINEAQGFTRDHSFSPIGIKKALAYDAQTHSANYDATRQAIKENFVAFQKDQGEHFDQKFGVGTNQNGVVYRGLRSREADEVAKLNVGDTIVLPTARSYSISKQKSDEFTAPSQKGQRYLMTLEGVSGKDHVYASYDHVNHALHMTTEQEVIIMGNHNNWEVSSITPWGSRTEIVLRPKKVKEADASKPKILQLHSITLDDDKAPVWIDNET